jgi:hypothetical protein
LPLGHFEDALSHTFSGGNGNNEATDDDAIDRPMKLSDPIFTDAEASREWMEAQRWPNGPVCPHCGNADPERITSLKGKAHRAGL